MNALILQTAFSQIGVKEIAGDEHNMTIVGYAHEIGLMWVNDDETPWCAIGANWVLMKSGQQFLVSARALDFLNYGTPTDYAEPGDLVVFDRGGGLGHVGFYLGHSKDGKKVFVLGGNQGNAWGVAAYPADKVVGYRRVTWTTSLEIPSGQLTKGSKGEAVKQLQSILKYLKVYDKVIDGDFGDGTLSAVISFQTKYKLPTTGRYDEAMKDKLFSILNA